MDEYHFQNIEYHICKAISNAKSRILVAVAWLTSFKIASILIEKNYLTIEVIVDDNHINQNSKSLKQVIASKIDVKFIKNSDYLMHNKFCIIDNSIVITGSYNWTINANNNNENIAILKGTETAALYAQEFRAIKNYDVVRNSPFILDTEVKEIQDLLYTEIKTLIKEKFNSCKLLEGDLLHFKSDKVLNKIRRADESVRNYLQKQRPIIAIYSDLLKKYGVDFYLKATEDELMISISNFKKNLVKNIEQDLDILFQRFKLKVIDMLCEKYRNLLLTYNDCSEESDRILQMHTYFRKEVMIIHTWLDQAILNSR